MSLLEPTGHPAHRAATLAERVARRHSGSPPSAAELDQGRVRLERWRAQPPFQDSSLFARRLELAGVEERELLWLLARRDEENDRTPPPWWTKIEAAYADETAHRSATRLLSEDAVAFWPLAAFAPLLAGAVEQAERLMPPHDVRFARFPKLCLPLLASRLLELAKAAVTLELNVKRERGALLGNTAKERFDDYVATLRTRAGALTLLAEYPVLARSALGMAEQWVCFCSDVAQHLRDDCHLLARELPGAFGTGTPEAVRGDLSDPHRGGRSVLIVRFEHGSEIVYKPRSLKVEARFQEFLRFLGERGLDPPLRRLVVVDRGDHGWMEMAAAASCETPDEVRRFYRRQGSQLAILHALGGTDFHYENIIAAGEQPLLVDLECLFARYPTGADERHFLVEAQVRSVLVIGLLPRPQTQVDDASAWDVSGLGARGGGTRWFPRLRDDGSDRARLDRELGTSGTPASVPRLRGREVDLADHLEDVATGFSDAHRLLQRNRAALLAKDGPVDAFGDAPVRFLARATEGYARLLNALAHPHCLGDGLARERMIDRLWAATAEWPYYLPLVEHEQRDIRMGDIPYFATRPDSRDLLASDGTVIRGFFAADGLTVVRRRIADLDANDLRVQLRVLRAAIQVAAGVVDEPPPTRVEGVPPSPDRQLKAASEIASRVAELAVEVDGGLAYFAPAYAGGNRWRYEPVSVSLYSGQLGVAVFLGHLARLTGEGRVADSARATADPVARLLRARPSVLRDIGGMAGWGGVIIACLHLAALWEDHGWLDLAISSAHEIDRLLPLSREADLVSGAAGALLAALRLGRRVDAERNVDLARRCADQLLAHAVPIGDGLGWKSPRLEAPPLAGMSHGAAGVAWALAEAATATGDRRYAEAAAAAHRYEQSLYDPEQGNWRDLRPAEDGFDALPHAGHEPSPCAWCHGAPGIALGRCLALPHLLESDRAPAREQMEMAAATLLSRPQHPRDSLCHGELGNLLILQRLDTAMPGPGLAARIATRSGDLLAEAELRGWRADAVAGVQQVGLMTGLAGIGYGLLRLAAPESVPDILALEVPGDGGASASSSA